MSKAQHDAKKAAELKAALAAKPPTPGFFEKPAPEDYVPPPVVDLGLIGPTTRRRPLPSEQNQDLVREVAAVSVEEAKLEIGRTTHFGLPGPTPEAEEAARREDVRQLKVRWAKDIASGKMPEFDRSEQTRREVRVQQENLDFVKAEMMRSIHTEDYSG